MPTEKLSQVIAWQLIKQHRLQQEFAWLSDPAEWQDLINL